MMLKALIKKQLMEVNTWLLLDKTKGTRRSKGGIIGLALLYAFLFLVLGGMFCVFATELCEPLHEMGLDWLYFAMMGMMSLLLGLFGSVFNTSATLYQAKDNALLLAMPIPPRYILAVRLFGVWLWSLIYEALVFVPALLIYWLCCPVNFTTIVCQLLLPVLMSLLILALACALGWVVAKISAKTKHKSFVTVVMSLVFLAAYYLFYFRINQILQYILVNAQTAGAVISKIFPIYWMGKAGAGAVLDLLLFAALVCACLGATVWVMSRSFLKMATISTASNKKAYRKGAMKAGSQDSALLKKELRRFGGSAIYMLNCGLGCLLFPVLGIAALLKAELILNVVDAIGLSAHLLPVACGAMCMAASMNAISAPSISLEGKQLWLAQSLPIRPWQALKAKLRLHLLINTLPVVFCAVCICVALKLEVLSSVLAVGIPMLFVLLSGVFGLAVNLKMPNLNWTNEAVPVKQSLSVTLALFGGWVFVIILGLGYLALGDVLGAAGYLIACGVLVALLSAVLLRWLKTKGSQIFAWL